MKYMLDTNVCIGYLSGRSEGVVNRLDALPEEDVVLCSIVRAELFYGAMRSQNPERTLAGQRQFLELFVSLPFNDAAAEHYARIRADLDSKGTPIGPNDLLIASIALAADLTLVTHNVSEFSRVSGLELEDWEA